MKLSILAAALLVLSALSSPAVTYTFVATGPDALGLSPLNENPPHPESKGSGTALVTWDTVTNQMSVQVVFSGLLGTTTASHIHCCATPPNNAMVATTVPTFPGFPLGVASGTYSRTFNMLDAGSYNPAFVTAQGGLANAMKALLAGMLAGQTYLNVHSTQFPGGEIRGFLTAPVDISIKLGNSPPVPINPRSHGKIPVAILSTATFNALTDIDTTSLTFGRTGRENSLAFCNSGGPDLICHFDAEAANFQSGDTLGILMGKTVQGTPLIGQEAIVTVPR